MKELIKLRIAYLLAAAYNQGYADCEADESMNEYSRGDGGKGFDFDLALSELSELGKFKFEPTPSAYLVNFDPKAKFKEQVTYLFEPGKVPQSRCSVPEYEFYIGVLKSSMKEND